MQLTSAIVEMKRRNRRFGRVRIAQQVSHGFGFAIDKDVVHCVLAKHYRSGDTNSDGPSWVTLIAQTKDSLWSVDLFGRESILLRSHWVLLVIDVCKRRLVGFGVERASIDGVSVCRMFNHAHAGQRLPRHLSNDHDALFRSHRRLANLRLVGIEEIKSVTSAPLSHPFIERLIGTIRREHLDRASIWNAMDLPGSRRSYGTIGTPTAFIARSPATHARNAPERLPHAPAALDHYARRRIVVGCSSPRSPLE